MKDGKEIKRLNRIGKSGKILSDNEISFIRRFDRLFNKKIVRIETEIYIKHANRTDADYYSIPKELRECEGIILINEDDYGYCDKCNSEISFNSKKRFKKFRINISEINLLKYLNTILNKLGLSRIRTSLNWKYVIKDKNVFLSIYGLNGFRKNHSLLPSYAQEPIGIIDCKPYQYNNEPYIKSVWWIILNELSQINNWLDGLSVFINRKKPSMDEIDNYFSTKIDALNPDLFEEYYKELLNEIIKNPINFKEKMNELSQLSTNALGQFAVKIGASGNPDIRYISKYEYYSVLFEPEAIGDTKFYTAKNYITVKDHLEQLIRHSRGKKGVIISSNNDIQTTIWEELYTEKIHNNNKWKYVVITRDMLKEIVALFAPRLIDEKYRNL